LLLFTVDGFKIKIMFMDYGTFLSITCTCDPTVTKDTNKRIVILLDTL